MNPIFEKWFFKNTNVDSITCVIVGMRPFHFLLSAMMCITVYIFLWKLASSYFRVFNPCYKLFCTPQSVFYTYLTQNCDVVASQNNIQPCFFFVFLVSSNVSNFLPEGKLSDPIPAGNDHSGNFECAGLLPNFMQEYTSGKYGDHYQDFVDILSGPNFCKSS